MKALVITPYYYPKIGGLENYARNLNRALINQEGWQIVVVTSQLGRSSTYGTIDSHPIYRLGTWFKLSNTPFSPLWPLQIRSIIAREQPDIIIAHAPVPSLADAAIHAKGKVPFVLVYHAATLMKAGSPLFNIAVRLYGLIGNTTLRRSDKIFAVSDYVRTQFSPSLQQKSIVVPNAVALAEIIPRTQPSKPEFVFIASLDRSHAWKGLSEILQAVAIYTNTYGGDVRLTVVGDGNARVDYEQTAERLGIRQNVRFVGAQVGAQKLRILRHAIGMLVYPTTENDAFPTVMLEAWANYVPVIGGRIGAVATLIHNGKDGLLCEPLQPSALAAAMHKLVELEPAGRAQIAVNAASRTSRKFTWEQQAKLVHMKAKELV